MWKLLYEYIKLGAIPSKIFYLKVRKMKYVH